MFGAKGTIDFIPRILLQAHEIVSSFARELRDRAREYMDKMLSREIKNRRNVKVNIRPWQKNELEAWRDRMLRKDAGRDPQKRIGSG
jgi:hypothetical protein